MQPKHKGNYLCVNISLASPLVLLSVTYPTVIMSRTRQPLRYNVHFPLNAFLRNEHKWKLILLSSLKNATHNYINCEINKEDTKRIDILRVQGVRECYWVIVSWHFGELLLLLRRKRDPKILDPSTPEEEGTTFLWNPGNSVFSAKKPDTSAEFHSKQYSCVYMKLGQKHLLVKLAFEAFNFSKQYLTNRFNLAENTRCYKEIQFNVLKEIMASMCTIWAE
jgi:hypothetical protein